MNGQKRFPIELVEMFARDHAEPRTGASVRQDSDSRKRLRWLGRQMVPNIGTLLLVVVLLLTVPSLAAPRNAPQATSTSTISYQGRLADSAGNPLTGYYNLEFRIYDVPSGGTPLWEEFWTGGNAVQVSDGLFNVMLGSLDDTLASAIEGHDELYLGITVGTDSEMVPRVQLGSVPFSMQAMTVPDGSITTDKIADGAINAQKLAPDIDIQFDAAHGLISSVGARLMTGPGGGTWQTWPASETHASFVANDINDNLAFVIYGDGNAQIGTTDHTCRLDVYGDFHATGTKSAVVQTATFGERTLYSAESPEVRFFDEGLAQLENGSARVELDPIFLETIEGDYLVHVTPYGAASLYVVEIGRDYFVVRAWEGDTNVTFAWRLSAHRKGYADVRLEESIP